MPWVHVYGSPVCAYLSICPSNYLSIYPATYLSIYLPIYLSILNTFLRWQTRRCSQLSISTHLAQVTSKWLHWLSKLIKLNRVTNQAQWWWAQKPKFCFVNPKLGDNIAVLGGIVTPHISDPTFTHTRTHTHTHTHTHTTHTTHTHARTHTYTHTHIHTHTYTHVHTHAHCLLPILSCSYAWKYYLCFMTLIWSESSGMTDHDGYTWVIICWTDTLATSLHTLQICFLYLPRQELSEQICKWHKTMVSWTLARGE